MCPVGWQHRFLQCRKKKRKKYYWSSRGADPVTRTDLVFPTGKDIVNKCVLIGWRINPLVVPAEAKTWMSSRHAVARFACLVLCFRSFRARRTAPASSAFRPIRLSVTERWDIGLKRRDGSRGPQVLVFGPVAARGSFVSGPQILSDPLTIFKSSASQWCTFRRTFWLPHFSTSWAPCGFLTSVSNFYQQVD